MPEHYAEGGAVESTSHNSTNQKNIQAVDDQHCPMDTMVTSTDQELGGQRIIESNEYDSDVQLIGVVTSSPITIEDGETTDENEALCQCSNTPS